MFIAALFIVAKTLKQPTCPSTDEWIKKMCVCVCVCVCVMEYYSVIKKEQNNVICSKANATRDYTKCIGIGEG